MGRKQRGQGEYVLLHAENGVGYLRENSRILLSKTAVSYNFAADTPADFPTYRLCKPIRNALPLQLNELD